jgi:hypothetical protein
VIFYNTHFGMAQLTTEPGLAVLIGVTGENREGVADIIRVIFPSNNAAGLLTAQEGKFLSGCCCAIPSGDRRR